MKNVLQEKFPEWFGRLTREPICFWEDIMKNQLKLMIYKMGVTDLTLAQKSEVCYM